MRILSSLLLVALSTLPLSAQVVLSSDDFAQSGNSVNNVVRDAAGNLFALSVTELANGDRPLLLQISTDDGATWVPIPVTLNDASSGLSGPDLANNCSMAIDDRGVLHILWASYRYPSPFFQWYTNFDPNGGVQSPIVNVSSAMGASSNSRTGANDIAVDPQGYVYIAAHSSSSWREKLAVSSMPFAAALTFNDLGFISPSASAQYSRLTIDAAGLVHCSYYRNISPGVYEHRIYDPANGWQPSTILGNTTPSRDLLGHIRADALGNVHALWVEDADNNSTWKFRYDIWDAANGWSGNAVPLMDVTTAQYSGIANYQITALNVDQDTGEAWVAYRDLPNGGDLKLAKKGPADPGFIDQASLTASTLNQHAYYRPTIRGTLYPAFNRMSGKVDMTWHSRQTNGSPPYEFTFASYGAPVPTPLTIALSSPAAIGTTTAVAINGTTLPNEPYVCAFSEGTGPDLVLADGRTVPIDINGFFFNYCLQPANGIFFDTIGTLDAAGAATTVLLVPNTPSIIGFTLDCAAVTLDPSHFSGVGEIANPLPITIQ